MSRATPARVNRAERTRTRWRSTCTVCGASSANARPRSATSAAWATCWTRRHSRDRPPMRDAGPADRSSGRRATRASRAVRNRRNAGCCTRHPDGRASISTWMQRKPRACCCRRSRPASVTGCPRPCIRTHTAGVTRWWIWMHGCRRCVAYRRCWRWPGS